VVGDNPHLLAVVTAPTWTPLRNLNPQLLRADGHLVLEGDTLAVLAQLLTTPPDPPCAEYKPPDLDRYHRR